MSTAKAIEILRLEIAIIRRATRSTDDLETADIINHALRSMAEAVDEIELDMQPNVEDEAIAA